MKVSTCFIVVLISSLFVARTFSYGQNVPQHVTLVQLIATPEKFEGTLVAVRGYLVLGARRDLTVHALYLNKDDADNLIGNSVLIVPSDQMLRDEEKFDRMYVMLTGKLHVARTADNSHVAAIREIIDCKVWSDPNHPVGLKDTSPSKNK